jgi:hypothetical protein
MFVQHPLPFGKGVVMAIPAEGTFIGRQQPRSVTNMGIMTDCTGVFRSADAEMCVHLIETLQRLLMTVQAKLRASRFVVAGFTVLLGKRCMTDSAQQLAIITAMRIMAAQTIDLGQVATQMCGGQSTGRLVTIEAQAAAVFFQQPVITSGMGVMACTALAFGKRSMGDREILPHSFMTAEAETAAAFLEKICVCRSMWFMTGTALTRCQRLVSDLAGRESVCQLLVAGEAEFGFWL